MNTEETIDKEQKFTVRKDKRFFTFKEYANLTINESRLLHSYLAKINPQNIKTKKRQIPIKWITDVFHLKTDVGIMKAIKTFKTHNNWIDISTGEYITIFETIELGLNCNYEKVVIMKCSPEAEKYFFPD